MSGSGMAAGLAEALFYRRTLSQHTEGGGALGVAGKENCQPVTFLPPLPPDKLKLHSVRVVAAEG